MNFLKQTFDEFLKDRCTTMAAALAYYTAFALPPLLFLLLTVLTFGLSLAYESGNAKQRAQAVLEDQATEMLGNESAAEGITKILRNNRESGGTWWKSLISFAGIIVGATGVVGALQDSLNRVWQVKPDPDTSSIVTILIKRIISLAMILALGFLLLVSIVVSSVLSTAGQQLGSILGVDGGVAAIINYLVQAAVVFIVFAAIFKFMPDAVVQWRNVFAGAAITTALFLAGRYAMQVYFSYSEPGAELGAAAASLAVILVWVYYSSMIVLLGAEATQVYAVRFGNGIQPESNAVRVVEEIRRPEAG
ncbi:YihY/virulence factor BrkB family protein [Stieleria sp. ICT_E10.1]|uniref:YihY/virulence factor BrkB family protein n=1 Tax=Stieleria sedimenti TaxID=2976331 RepID=UPI00217FF8EB|nr:YihY/virulence factor BrkB family protein [Stieleria sedimenti]MCS7469755.1 YihY/virulence factor BrkB family protein [Stieleria sedimenti]